MGMPKKNFSLPPFSGSLVPIIGAACSLKKLRRAAFPF